jgi:uncharacterized protein (DUF302 family)
MMKKLIGIAVVSMVSFLYAHDIQIFSVDNKDGTITPKTIEAEFKKAGFYINDNRDMNIPFMKQFKQTDFKVYNLFTFAHIPTAVNLAKEYPSVGLFTPLSMSIYTKKGEDKIHVSSLTLDGLSKITGIPKDNKDLIVWTNLLNETIQKALPNGSFEKIPYDVQDTRKELVTKMYIKFHENNDWEEDSDNLIEEFEAAYEMQGFVQAGYTNVNYKFNEIGDNYFDLFVAESVCKLPVIYEVAKTRPEAGAFAPCSVMIYKKKTDDFFHVEYPNVYNWIASLDIDDDASLEQLLSAQGKMETILYQLKTDYDNF